MTAVEPVTDPAVERLNYRNGQRIVAADLRAEQNYHIGVRRWLNRTLFNPGIAKGLEVTVSPTNNHAVVVSPGLAIDVQGRELIVPIDTPVPVSGVPSTSTGVVFGNYLIIEFREERGAPGGVECTGETAPARIRSTPSLSMQNAWPSAESGRIPLAQIELTADCRVARVHTAIRRYASTSKPPKVRGISLEGEKDIAGSDSKILYFHVRGGYPDSAILYLRASRFSTTAYTEVGWHTHQAGGDSADVTFDLTHSHTASGGTVSEAGEHTHNYFVDAGETHGGIDVNQDQVVGRINTDPSAIIPAGKHTHNLEGVQIGNALASWTHHHASSAGGGGGTGVAQGARIGIPYSFFADLDIYLDGNAVTNQIRTQVQARSADDWTRMGDGSPGHAFVATGTGEIDLLQIADLGPREHTLEFRASTGGGRLHYNLYVE
jgi:hypothetical protein